MRIELCMLLKCLIDMKKTLCYSVRVDSVSSVSEKAVLITCFDGSKDIFPKSAIFGPDYEVQKSQAYWIAAWILPKKNIQYSCKKSAWFDENGKMLPAVTVSKHKPDKVSSVETNEILDLLK